MNRYQIKYVDYTGGQDNVYLSAPTPHTAWLEIMDEWGDGWGSADENATTQDGNAWIISLKDLGPEKPIINIKMPKRNDIPNKEARYRIVKGEEPMHVEVQRFNNKYDANKYWKSLPKTGDLEFWRVTKTAFIVIDSK